MSDLISPDANHADAETLMHSPEAPLSLSNQNDHFDRLAGQPQYRHFVRIPARIARCLDYFDVLGDRPAAEETLLAYYVFIGVVDQAIDSGDPMTATIVFNRLKTLVVDHTATTDVGFVTERLKSHVNDALHQIFLDKLHHLYGTVLDERRADSIESYIETRKHLGRLTAELSYLLIRPALRSEQPELREFMEEVGAIGCLVDSVVDLRIDRRRGLLNFELTFLSQFKLLLSTLSAGLSISLAHPRLLGLFAQAIADSVRDRFNRMDTAGPRLANQIRSEVPGVG